MTLTDPPSPPSMEFSIIDFIFFLNPSLIHIFSLKYSLLEGLKNLNFFIPHVTPQVAIISHYFQGSLVGITAELY